MLWLVLQHTMVTALLIGVVVFVCRFFRPHPTMQHALWTIVLLKFLVPPVMMWPGSVEDVARMIGVPVLFATSEHGNDPVAGPDRSFEEDSGPGYAFVADYLAARPQRSDGQSAAALAGRSAPVIAPQSTIMVDDDDRVVTGRKQAFFWSLMGVWFVGAVFCAAWNAWRIYRLQRLVARGTEGSELLHNAVAKLSSRMGIRAPRIVVSGQVATPFIWCLPSMKLVWPAALAPSCTSASVDCILVHELAHLRRRDHWIAWLDLAANIVWWWNPLAWYSRRRLNDAAELACDTWVMWLFPDDRRIYADSLVTLSEENATVRDLPVPAMGARLGVRRAFERRLVMIMCSQTSLRPGKSMWYCVGLLLLLTIPGIALATRNQDEGESARLARPAESDATADQPEAATKQVEPPATISFPVASAAAQDDDSNTSPGVDIEVLSEIMEKLSNDQPDKIDRQALIEAAIQGMLKRVDENAAYLPEDDLGELFVNLEGTVGVGVVLNFRDDQLMVMRTLPSSPAAKAGLISRDVIEEVDGKSVDELGDVATRFAGAVRLIRGKPGDPVTLGVRREGSAQLKQIRVVRGAIKVDSVRGFAQREGNWQFVLDDESKIGYVRVTGFNKTTAQDSKNGSWLLGVKRDPRPRPGFTRLPRRSPPTSGSECKLVREKGRDCTCREHGWLGRESRVSSAGKRDQ